MANLSYLVERIEKECGFKLERNHDTSCTFAFQKKNGDGVHVVELSNRLDDPQIRDWTILSYTMTPGLYPKELTHKEYEFFRDVLQEMKRWQLATM